MHSSTEILTKSLLVIVCSPLTIITFSHYSEYNCVSSIITLKQSYLENELKDLTENLLTCVGITGNTQYFSLHFVFLLNRFKSIILKLLNLHAIEGPCLYISFAAISLLAYIFVLLVEK